MPFERGHDANKDGKARHAGRLSSSDAGAPAPAPRSPRARRFRRHRSLSSPPLHRGALETAPAAGTAAPDDAMATDASHATVRLPAPPAPPAGKPPPQLPPSRFCAPMRTVDLTPFRVCRALLAFGSESASEGKRTSAARRGSVVAAASISQKQMRSVAR